MLLLDHPDRFTRDCRVLFLKGRHKDGVKLERTRIRVSRSSEEFRDHLIELRSISAPGERIYASAGSRDLERAARVFRERQLASEYDADPLLFYRRLDDRWASSLMSPRAQEEKLWLLDCDSEGEVKAVRESIHHAFVNHEYASKSGRHFIVEPFNRSLVPPEVRRLIHDNAIILWGY